MPFTPLHMGPGLLLKAGLRDRFSLTVFGWSQVVMDIQPLVVMLSGHGRLHGLTHTYVGALLLAVLSALTGKYLAERGLSFIGYGKFLPVTWTAAWASAALGTFSHVLLDSFMHHDMEPFWPLSAANGLSGIVSVEALHWVCLGSGLAGVLIWLALVRRQAMADGSGEWRR